MAKYMVHCDGCGMIAVVENTESFICKNCNYDICTVDERPTEPVIGKECADLLEDLYKNGPDKVQE